LARPFGQIPLQMATEPRVIVENAQQDRIRPATVAKQYPEGTMMEIQVPEPVDILALITAYFPGLVTMLGDLGARTVDRSAARPLEQAVAFHPAQQGNVGRQRAGLGLLLDHDRQVVEMKLVTPTGMLLVLLGQQLDEFGIIYRGMPAVVGADLALERFHRPGFGTQRLVIPSLDGRTTKDHPIARNRVAPLFDGQFLELGLQLAA